MTLPQRIPRRRRPRSIQAAARSVPSDERRFSPAEPNASGGFGWQTRAWHVYRHLGAIHYSMSFIRDNVSLIDFYVAEVSDDPEAEPEPLDLDDPAAVELERLGNGPYGGVPDLFAELVVHDKVAGEGRLSVRYERDGEPVAVAEGSEPPADAEEVWEVLTTQTKRRRENDPLYRPVQSVRIWRPDPERPEFPDSSLRAVLAECEQLLLIQQMTTGTLRSRLHNGILVYPEEIDPAPPAPPDEGDDEMSPLMRDMFKVFTLPINDPDSAAAIMPYLLAAKGELLEQIRHISLGRDFDAQILEIKHDLLTTVAGGIDLPAERLTGLADSNHWSAWLLDDITYSQHLKPAVDLVVRGVLIAWLKPAWEAAGLDPDAYTIHQDTSELTAKVMKSADAIQVYKLGEMSGEGLRRHTGFDESDAPTEDDPGLRGQVSQRDIDIPAGPDTVEPGPPVTAAASIEDLGSRLAAIDSQVLADLTELVEAAVAEQTEEAEARLLEAMAAAGISTDTEPLAQALADANISPEAIVPDDAFGAIREPTRDIMIDGLGDAAEAIGIEGVSEAEGDRMALAAVAAAAGLSNELTDWLRSRWFDDSPKPDGAAARFARHGEIPEVPPGLLLDAMTEAGGGLGSTPGSRGVANARTIEGWLLESGMATVGWRWVHGSPPEPFPPHRRLHGVTFTSFDADVLENRTNTWPHVTHFYPGDHGVDCTCRWEKILLPSSQIQVG